MGSMWLHLMTTSVLLSLAFADCDLTEDPPQIEIFPLEQTVTKGSSTVFVCKVNTKLQIKWRRHGRKIRYHPQNAIFPGSPSTSDENIPKFEKILITNGSALKINSAEPGTFECIARNGTEELVRATAQLKTIDSPPKIEIFPQNQTVETDGIAIFVCMVTGSSYLQIKWTKNNGDETQDRARCEFLYGSRDTRDIVQENLISDAINMTNGSMIRIHALGPESFDCVVEYGADEPARATAHLNTVRGNTIPDGFPFISPQNTDVQRVSKGHRTLIPCLVKGDPKPTVRWLRNKLPLNMSIPRYSLFEEEFLQISDAIEVDEGEYECIANNSVGTALSTKLKLVVIDSLQSPYFTIEPEELYITRAGSSRNITCLANGSPQPSVKWMNDSTVISPSRSGLNVLVLTDIQGSHNYTCVASSEMGETEATAQVIAQLSNFPVAPTNLRVSNVNGTCIDLSWSYDYPEDNIIFFRIELSIRHSTDPYRSVIHNLPKLSRTLCHLHPDTEYEFRVTALNKPLDLHEYGPRSSSVFATTKKI